MLGILKFNRIQFKGIREGRGGSVGQADRCSSPTAGVPSSRLDHSIWVSWWTKRSLGRFFLGFPCHKFHPTISPHSSHSFRFISFSSATVVVRQACSAGILAIHRPSIKVLHRTSTWPCVGYMYTD